jgi:ParB/RepB/Spo0J family partition protein
MAKLKKLQLCDIDPPDNPMREFMDPKKLNELAESMAAEGLKQPIAVVEDGVRYKVVFGDRRYVAARQLSWQTIDCIVYKPGDINLEAAMLAENTGREDVNAADEALWYTRLMEALNMDTDQLADKLHRSRDYVEDRVRLSMQDENVFAAVRARQINFSVGRELNKIDDEGMRRYYLDAAIRGEHSARTVASWRAQWEANSAALPAAGTPAVLPTKCAACGAENEQHAEGCTIAAVLPAAKPAENFYQCKFCGGNKDPWNLVTIMVHKWELEAITKQLAQPPSDAAQNGGAA